MVTKIYNNVNDFEFESVDAERGSPLRDDCHKDIP